MIGSDSAIKLVVGKARDVALHTIPVTDLFGKLGYGFVMRPGRYLPASIRAFLEVAGIASADLPNR